MALMLWRDGRAETIATPQKDGNLELCEKYPPPPVIKFCVVLTTERGWKKR